MSDAGSALPALFFLLVPLSDVATNLCKSLCFHCREFLCSSSFSVASPLSVVPLVPTPTNVVDGALAKCRQVAAVCACLSMWLCDLPPAIFHATCFFLFSFLFMFAVSLSASVRPDAAGGGLMVRLCVCVCVCKQAYLRMCRQMRACGE